MLAKLLGSYYNVNVSKREVEAFKAQWPCSGLPNRAFWFQFSADNGDLVEVQPDSEDWDGSALLALSEDAGRYGAKKLGILDWRYPTTR